MLFVLNDHNSIANQFLLELRDKTIQNDRMRFRRNMERLGEIMAYEISKRFTFVTATVRTPLGETSVQIPKEKPLLLTILRAGLPYLNGFLNLFDQADCGFIGAYREEKGDDLTIRLSYIATEDLTNRTVLLIDPMLATGRSVKDAIDAITKKNGLPHHIHVVSLVSSPAGIDFLKKNLKLPFSLWTCAVDEKLDENYYIVPGLGDAGDLSFGLKK